MLRNPLTKLLLFALLIIELAIPVVAFAQSMRDTEREIHAVFLNQIAQSADRQDRIVLDPETVTTRDVFSADSGPGAIAAQFPEATAAVIADFSRVNATSVPMTISKELVQMDISLAVADQRRLRIIFKETTLDNAWRQFRREYPGAKSILQLSRVGLDPESNQALLYVRVSCGSRCGSGFVTLFQLKSGRWEAVRESRVWIS